MLEGFQKMKKTSWILNYTIWFTVFSLVVYSLNLFQGRSFIYTTQSGVGDGLVQHYNALMYYDEWLRTVFYDIFVNHDFHIPMWDLSIGLGGDILTTLSFYVLGDPFSFLSVFVPKQNTEVLYQVLIIARLYAAGFVFCIYCRYHNYKEQHILIGSMIYVFSFYSIVVSVLHPYFLNPLIYLPLILMGIDKILNDETPFVFILSCGVAAISNFYFFYMLSIIMVIYAVIRYLTLYSKDFQMKHLLKKFMTCTVGYLVGIMLAAPVFIPAAMSILQSDRIGSEPYVPLLYDFIYYAKLVIAFVNASADYYSALGYTVIAVWAVFMFIFRTKWKEKVSLKIGLFIGGIFLCLPFFGHVLNGFSYVVNRWVWAFCFVISLIVVEMMPRLLRLKWRHYVGMSVTAVLFAACTFYFRSAGSIEKLKSMLITLGVMSICFFVVLVIGRNLQRSCVKENVYNYASYYTLIGILAVNLFFNMYGFFSETSGGDILNHGISGDAYHLYMSSVPSVVNKIDDANEVRYDTAGMDAREVMVNSAMQHDINGTAFYYSTTNNSVEQYIQNMELDMMVVNQFFDMDSRAWLDTALGVKYVGVRDTEEAKAYLPYGYRDLVKRENGYAIYTSPYVLPLVYSFDGYILESDYEKMTSVQKQQAVLQGMVLSQEEQSTLGDLEISQAEVCLEEYSSPYEIIYQEGIAVEGNKLIVNQDNAIMIIRTEQVENCERYLRWSNLFYYGEGNVQISVSGSKVSNGFTIASRESIYYIGARNILLNLGYAKTSDSEYTIRFQSKGIYDMEGLEVVNLPCGNIEAYTSDLTNEKIDYEMLNEQIKIKSVTDSDKLIYLAVPYSTGWSAQVDGIEVPVYRANDFGMGIAVEKGEHQIILSYCTPYLKEGICLSVIAILSCFVIKKRYAKLPLS